MTVGEKCQETNQMNNGFESTMAWGISLKQNKNSIIELEMN